MHLPSGWQLVIIAVIALLIFGAPKLPRLARNLGQSMRILKSEVKQMMDDDDSKSEDSKHTPKNDSVSAVEGTVVDNPSTTENERKEQR